MKIRYLLAILSTLILFACSNQQSDVNGAEVLYNEADSAFKAGNMELSKVLIDSIHSAYRMDVEVRKRAVELMHSIKEYEAERTQHYIDSVRPLRQATFDSLMKFFRVSSDTAYYKYKKYIHRSQNSAAPRISLIAEVKEDGELQLISVYMGRKLDHKRVRVENKDKFFVESNEIPLESPYNNRFDDFGTRWEYLTIAGNNLNDLPQFISSNANGQLKVTLYADSVQTKRGMKAVKYTYLLDPQDRNAIRQAVELSIVTSELNKMRKR